MFLNLLLLRNSRSQPVHFKCFVVFKASHRKKCSVNANYPVFISKNTVPKCISNLKYLQCFLRRPNINYSEILPRNLSTSSHLSNVEKNSNENSDDPKYNGIHFLIAGFLAAAFFLFFAKDDERLDSENISWEEFKHEMLAKGEVKKLMINYKMRLVAIELHDGAIVRNKPALKYYLMEVPEVEKFVEKVKKVEEELGILPKDGVPIEYVSDSVHHLFLTLGWLLILVSLISGVVMGAKSGMKNMPDIFGFSKAKFTLVDPLAGEGRGVKFSDVAGMKEAKTEIIDFVDYLKRPDVYRSLGAKVPKGALLLGPPGCGKTLLAKAVATEANVPFLSMNGSEFIELIAGLGAARVRDLFKEAKKRSPCIIYIDEIDAIGKKRESHSSPYGVNEAEQTLNQLLVEMDGVVPNEGVVLLASTNRPEVLDAALLRPGRFDRQILIDLPTLVERQQIFEQHLKDINLEKKPEAYSKRMAQLTPGFSGADIANVCNEAALHAARLKKKIVQESDLEYAIERVVGGAEKKSSALSPEEKKMLAYYEAGRALVGWLSKYGEGLLKVTIVSRTDSPAGWSHFAQSDRFLYSMDDLRGKMCMGLGGRVALTLLFNRVTTAGEKDLKKVTKVAYAQVKRFGMSKRIGLLSFDFSGQGSDTLKKPYSKALASLFDEEARLIVRDAYKETEKIISENKDKLIKLAEELLKKETLNYDDIVNIIGPPLFKEKKFIEPLEFALSLDQAAGPEPESTDKNE